MHSLRVLALAGEVLLTVGGHRATIHSRELGKQRQQGDQQYSLHSLILAFAVMHHTQKVVKS